MEIEKIGLEDFLWDILDIVENWDILDIVMCPIPQFMEVISIIF